MSDFKYSIGSRLADADERRLKVPGPGTYDSRENLKFQTARSSKFPDEKRDGMANKATKFMPGPGAHNPDFNASRSRSPRFGIGTGKRSPPSSLIKTPGAGTYQLNPLVGREGRSISMHQKINFSPEKKEKANVPGPGNYSPDVAKVKSKEPSYGLGSSTRADLAEKVRNSF